MNKILMITASVVALTFAAEALADASAQGCASSGNTAAGCSTNNGGNGGNGGKGGNANNSVTNTNTANGGSANNTNSNTANGGNASNSNSNNIHNNIHNTNNNSNSNSNSNHNSNSNSNHNSATGGNATGGTGVGVASAETGASTATNTATTGSITNIDKQVRQAPAIAAPALAVSDCIGSTSGGVSGPGFGLTLGGTHTHEGCELRAKAAMMKNLGHPKVADALMCTDDAVRQAMHDAGEVCPGEDKAAAKAKVLDSDYGYNRKEEKTELWPSQRDRFNR